MITECPRGAACRSEPCSAAPAAQHAGVLAPEEHLSVLPMGVEEGRELLLQRRTPLLRERLCQRLRRAVGAGHELPHRLSARAGLRSRLRMTVAASGSRRG